MYRKEPFPIQEKPLCIINDPFYYRIRDAVPNGKGRKRTKSSIHPLAEKHRRTCRGEKLKKYTPCTFEDSSKIVEAIAEVHAELVLIHPFREGNGRVSRVLATLMALQAGLPLLDFSAMNEQKEKYFAAVQAGLERNYQPMETLFADVIESSVSASDD